MNPNVNLSLPEMESSPMFARNIPITSIIRPFKGDPPDRNTASKSPTNAREKYSGGPNFSENSARGGATKVSPITPKVPAINEPIAETPSAAPARPFFAISYPSMLVTTEAASPGNFRSIEVVDPPYMEP